MKITSEVYLPLSLKQCVRVTTHICMIKISVIPEEVVIKLTAKYMTTTEHKG